MKNLIVMDNFYKNGQAVRDYALNKASYIPQERLSAKFPGTESVQSFFSDAVVKKMEHAIGSKIKVEPKKYSFGVFAKTYAADEKRKVIHIDESDWTGLVYLSRPEDCKGGTVFYQHRKSGMDIVPADDKLQKMGYADKEDFNSRFIMPQSQDESKWKVSARVGLKFNRMVLFRAGRMFHAAEGYFGSHDQNCRLIQLFFFKTEGAL